MADTLASDHAIRRAAADVLGAGVLLLDELLAAIEGRGLVLARASRDRSDRLVDVLVDGAFAELDGERWLSMTGTLDATTWAAEVPAELAAAECLPCGPDLVLLAAWAGAAPVEVDGDPPGELVVAELDDGSEVLAGPEGWLDAADGADAADRADGADGADVRVAVFGARVAVVRLGDAPGPSPAQVGAVAAAFDRIADRDELVTALVTATSVEIVTADIEDLLWESLATDRSAFLGSVIPRADELLAAAGLELTGRTVVPQGTDHAVVARHRRRERLAGIHDLDEMQVDAAEVVIAASITSIAAAEADEADEAAAAAGSGATDPVEDEEFPAELAMFLSSCLVDPSVARAFAGEHAERDTDAVSLVGFARRLLAACDTLGIDPSDDPSADASDELFGAEAALGARWLLAHALDRSGDANGAQAELERAAGSGFDHPLVLRALAGFMADRGDAPAALELLRRADVDDDDPLVLEVAGYARHRPGPRAARNDPCPCGSGRKYKACHLGRERHALVDRAPWLFEKAVRYLRENRHRVLGATLASTIAEASRRGAGFLNELLDSPLVADLALCEAGVFDDFVAEREALLPDDEALLATRWLLVPRSLFEAEAIRVDELHLRDLRTGDRIVVTNTNSSEHTHPGALLLGRPLPVDDTWRAYSGFVGVLPQLRDEMLTALDDPNPFEIAALIGRTFAPPTLSNTDGEPLVFHELTFRLPDADERRSSEALTAAGLTEADDGGFTLVRDTTNQVNTLVMSMVLHGDTLEVSVNSDRRADEARALVVAAIAGAVLEHRDHRPVHEMLAARDPDETVAPTPDNDPELDAMLDELVRSREISWIDESIPALGGRTPREAVTDPVGREEVEQLLRSFDAYPGGRGTFDPDRLRSLLGLAPEGD